jgi:hypothetical protein
VVILLVTNSNEKCLLAGSTQLRTQIGTPAISQLSLDMTTCISYSK